MGKQVFKRVDRKMNKDRRMIVTPPNIIPFSKEKVLEDGEIFRFSVPDDGTLQGVSVNIGDMNLDSVEGEVRVIGKVTASAHKVSLRMGRNKVAFDNLTLDDGDVVQLVIPGFQSDTFFVTAVSATIVYQRDGNRKGSVEFLEDHSNA